MIEKLLKCSDEYVKRVYPEYYLEVFRLWEIERNRILMLEEL